MRTLDDRELLVLWESGACRHPLDRALMALAAALPETPYAGLSDWPIGRRNQALTRLRCLCFGPLLRGWTPCVKCKEKLEFEIDAMALTGAETWEKNAVDEPVIVNGRTFRLPTSRDLARLAGETDPIAGEILIANGCLVDPSPPATWSEQELRALGESLALSDPLSEIQLSFRCPGCGTEWEEPLDIVSFFWTEINARVRRLLFTVHTLASAYGWSEAEVLSLSENRRAHYMAMICT